MRTTKRTVISLDTHDTIEVEYMGRTFIIRADPDSHSAGPTIDLPGGAEMICLAGDEHDDSPLMEASIPAAASIFI